MPKPWRPQNHAQLGDTRSRDRDAIKRSNDRAAFVEARIASHGAADLNDWLRSNGVLGWGTGDASDALAIVCKRLGVDVWRAALDVVGVT